MVSVAPQSSVLSTQSYLLNSNLCAIEIEGTKLSDRCDSQFVAAKDLAGHPPNVRGCHAVDAFEDLVERKLAAEENLLPREVAHARRCRFQAEHDRNLELIFRSL